MALNSGGAMGLANIIGEVAEELGKAVAKHPSMKSAHEGYAIILEELDELWEEIKAQKPDDEKLRKEATQVAAMAMRFIMDVCYDGPEDKD